MNRGRPRKRDAAAKRAKQRKAQRARVVRVAQAPAPTKRVPDPPEGMAPAAFIRSAAGKAGGEGRAKRLSARQRQKIASDAARARWDAPQGTTCKAEPAGERVACDECGLSWGMTDPNCPICPRLAGLQVLPPISELEARARDICFTLLHGGARHDFDRLLAQRVDWQAHVNFIVVQLMATCSG